jgi:hypothetical protein
MLSRKNRPCSTSVKDAAWIEGRYPNYLCAATGVHPEALTEVQLAREGLFIRSDQRTPPGKPSLLEDGRTQIVRVVPERDVQVTIASPDPAEAARIAATVTVHEDGVSPEGCAWRASPVPTMTSQTSEPIAPAAPDRGLVCTYAGGWLIAAATLDAPAATVLADAFRAAPRGDPTHEECPERAIPAFLHEDHVLVELSEGEQSTRLWVRGKSDGVTRCQLSAGRNDQGRPVELVPNLGAAISHAARDDAADGGFAFTPEYLPGLRR